MSELPAKSAQPNPSRMAAALQAVAASVPEIASTLVPAPASTLLVTLQKAGQGFFGARLSNSENRRADIAAAAAVESIQSRLLGGEAIRGDWQEELRVKGQTSGQEIFEASLGLAARQYEERKAPHFGWAFAAIAFDETFSASEAHHALRVADSLSYHQLCVLAILPDAGQESSLTRTDAYEGEEGDYAPELVALLRDIAQMGREELVDLRFPSAVGWTPVHGYASVRPAFLAKRHEAVRWGEILRLDRLDASEVARVRALLS